MNDSPDQNDPRPKPDSGSSRSTEGWYQMAGAGFEFIVAVLLFGAIGYGLDRWLETSPWCMIVGFGLGFAAGLSILMKMARRTFHD